jgi:hypothetical protein
MFNIKALLAQIDLFVYAAEKESLPENSDNLSTILKNIEKLETYKARKAYAEKNLEHLSSGSSRIVYLTTDKTVIKLAKNDKGIAQNKAEANPKVKSKYINKIIGKAKNYSWIQTAYLDKLTEKEFEEITGINFEDFGDCIKYGLRELSSSKKKKPSTFDGISKTEIYKEIEKVGKKNSLMGGDFARISSYGVKDGHPVLIDTGLTKQIFESLYE